LDDEERITPFGEPSTDANPEPAVAVTEPWAWRPALQHDQLQRRHRFSATKSALGFAHVATTLPAHLIRLTPLPPSSTCWESFTGPARRKGRWIEFLRPTGQNRVR
jgi:hypothetical protein